MSFEPVLPIGLVRNYSENAASLEQLRIDPHFHAASARLNAIEAQGSPLRADIAGYLD
jgi:hypothetical protein